MAIQFKANHRSILLHIVIWSMLFILPHLFIDERSIQPFFFPASFFTITNLYHIGLFYLNAFLFYPLFFNKRKWWMYIFVIAVTIVVSYYLKLFVVKQWYPAVRLDHLAQRIIFFPLIPFLVASIIYRLIIDKIAYDKRQKEITAEQLSIKLKFLRSQINPHFIFNILASLVSLARKKSEQLEPSLIMLSDLMRYMLYESDEKKVLLQNEVNYLESYLELQKLRFGHTIKIDTQIDISEQEAKQNIEPMLLIPFLENSFKHGMGVDEPLIKICLTAHNGELKLDVENKFNDDINWTKDLNSGIGLENVRSRLALLYPKKHSLTLQMEKNVFQVHLTLQLS